MEYIYLISLAQSPQCLLHRDNPVYSAPLLDEIRMRSMDVVVVLVMVAVDKRTL